MKPVVPRVKGWLKSLKKERSGQTTPSSEAPATFYSSPQANIIDAGTHGASQSKVSAPSFAASDGGPVPLAPQIILPAQSTGQPSATHSANGSTRHSISQGSQGNGGAEAMIALAQSSLKFGNSDTGPYKLALKESHSVPPLPEGQAMGRGVELSHINTQNGSIRLAMGDQSSHTHHHYAAPEAAVKNLETLLSSIPSSRGIHEEFLAKAAPQTGMWLFKGDRWISWADPNSDVQFLWGSGLLGTGKSVLAALAITELQRIAKDKGGELCVTYHYFRYNAPTHITVRGVLEAFVKQIVQQRKDLLPLAHDVYAEHLTDGTQPSEVQLLDLMQRLSSYTTIACVIDALDQAPVSIQTNLVKKLSSLNCKLFITSRPLRTLEALFPDAHHFPISAHDEDINLLIDEKLGESPHLQELLSASDEASSFVDMLSSSIKRGCGGMLSYASLQLDEIQRSLNLEGVRKTLDTPPSGLQDLYRQEWKRVTDQDPAHARVAQGALMWLVNAERSLTLKELQHAVAVCPDTHRFVSANLVTEASLLRLCQGFVKIGDGSRLVHLVHPSAKEFVRALLQDTFPNPHATLATVCMTHLTDRGFPNATIASEDELRQALQAEPLLSYAYDSWAYHARISLDVEPCASQLARFINACLAFPVVTPVLKTFDLFNPLHVAAYFDLPPSLVKTRLPSLLNREKATDFNVPTGKLKCSPALVPFLRGPSINALNRTGYSALMTAVEMDKPDDVEYLLSLPETALNLQSSDGTSALMIAVRSGRTQCLKLLLAHSSVQVNLVDEGGKTALMRAVLCGEEDSTKLLLDHPDILVNLVDKDNHSTLILAVMMGFEPCVKLLLDRPDININHVDNKRKSALLLAAYQGHVGCVKLLLEHPDIQVNNVDDEDNAALLLAAYNGHEGCVQLLLTRSDIQVNSVDKEQHSALLLAAHKGHTECVKLLLTRTDVQVNHLDEDGRSPLMHAAMHGRDGCVSLLLDHTDIQVNLLATLQSTSALILAAFQGHAQCLKLLLTHKDTQVNLVDIDGHSALMCAALRGKEECMKLLLDHPDIDSSHVDTENRSALLMAVSKGHEGCAKLLLERAHVNVNHVDNELNSALIVAVYQGDEGCTKLLLAQSDIQVNLRDNRGCSALMYAVMKDHEGCFELLLAHTDIQVNLVDRNGFSPLMLAALRGREEFIKRLLARDDVQVNLKSATGQISALDLAASQGYQSIVDLIVACPKFRSGLESRQGHSASGLAAVAGHHGLAEILKAQKL